MAAVEVGDSCFSVLVDGSKLIPCTAQQKSDALAFEKPILRLYRTLDSQLNSQLSLTSLLARTKNPT